MALAEIRFTLVIAASLTIKMVKTSEPYKQIYTKKIKKILTLKQTIQRSVINGKNGFI